MQEIGAQLDFTPFFHLLDPPFELRPFLLDIKRRHKIGLATNRSVTVPRLIEHLNLVGIFDAVACTQDQVRPKPAPDIVNLCIERAGTAKDYRFMLATARSTTSPPSTPAYVSSAWAIASSPQ